jgi:tetratricopeptide (TPR) repeat protein
MTPELWERLSPLFNEAVELPSPQRRAFIAEACREDLELHRELLALVEAHEQQEAATKKIDLKIRSLVTAIIPPKLSEGELFHGRFKIVHHLGSGGMGHVYEAIDSELSQAVALKMIRPEIAENELVLSRFKKEVTLARRISGPNVCRIHEFFTYEATAQAPSGAFFTMELLDGISLADKVREGPLPWREAEGIGLDICVGLAIMHGAGIIHRDLKSRNIMLADRGGAKRAVLMDFGLAHELLPLGEIGETAITLPGAVLGTPEYMAPEQFEGKAVSPATDIYAVGIVLYELVTGKHPFASSNALGTAVLRGRRPEPASSVNRSVPHRWDIVIGKCLEYDPSRRYQSAEEVAGDLRKSLQNIERLHEMALHFSRRQFAWMAGGLMLLALIILMLIPPPLSPPNPRAWGWYTNGTAAIREGAYLQAAKELQKAVNLDANFSLAHARLAEAWSELDFTGSAEQEMLLASAPAHEKNLPELDRNFIETVRATLTHDFAGAVRYQLAILKALPEDQQGYGYVDLGRAQEKAGDIAGALKSYETAAKLTPDNPAPFVHLGILKSRYQDAAGGEASFKQADDLYIAKGNLEGRAEVAFQRGHAANERGDKDLARESLQDCLQIARQIGSVQLEVRALTQLSDVEYWSDQDDKAIKDAEQAIQLANENNLEYWATDGLIREGNAYLDKRDFVAAEKVLQQALKLSQRDHHPHLEANTQFTLASLRDRQERWDVGIQFAQNALAYYKKFGFVGQAFDTATLIVRSQQGKGDTDQALKAAKELLEFAKHADSQARIETAEETVGTAHFAVEEYPAALAHFQEALKIARSTKENEAYQALHCADVLWRLGRYGEAEEILNSISTDTRTDIASGSDLAKAQMRLSQQRYAEALLVATSAIKKFAISVPANLIDLKSVIALAQANLGRIQEAQDTVQELSALANKDANPDEIASVNLLHAVIHLHAKSPDLAKVSAESASRYFSDKGKTESEWLSLYCLAEASIGLGDLASARQNAKKAIDIGNTVEHNWSSPVFLQYSARPDIHKAIVRLSQLNSQ